MGVPPVAVRAGAESLIALMHGAARTNRPDMLDAVTESEKMIYRFAELVLDAVADDDLARDAFIIECDRRRRSGARYGGG
jgi:hypothetical protein